MFSPHVTAPPRWASVASWLSWGTSLVRVVLVTGALLVVTGTTVAGPTSTNTVWAQRPTSHAVAWTSTLAERFPDCAPGLRLQPPGSVIEIGGGGIPVRVGFGDAWRRTHDRVRGNSGRILAQCRLGVGHG
jgi:hypothetical protein